MSKLDDLYEEHDRLETELFIVKQHIAMLEAQQFEEYKDQIFQDYKNMTQ
jgi:hypothetical protein